MIIIIKKGIKYSYVTQSTRYQVHHNNCVTTGREGWNKEKSHVASFKGRAHGAVM